MHLKSFQVKNFRKLQDVTVDLSEDTTIFVGANNSGKTSATHIFQLFLSETAKFTIYDFSIGCWDQFDPKEDAANSDDVTDNDKALVELPRITLDLWFEVDEANVHRVIPLLSDLKWKNKPVGVRLCFEPRNPEHLKARFNDARNASRDELDAYRKKNPDYDQEYTPWPINVYDYLTKRLNIEYDIVCYKILHKDSDSEQVSLFDNGINIVQSILRVDFMDAQRYLTDTETRGRAEDLSKRLSRFYLRNLQQAPPDFGAMHTLAESGRSLDRHFAGAFSDTISRLEKLGYPGLSNPHLTIKSDLKPESLLSGSAQVHYDVSDSGNGSAGRQLLLPDRFNGLGFKNLIYMVVEILDFYYSRTDPDGAVQPVHIVMIEEPESHLHAQLQQVFIKQLRNIIDDKPGSEATQFIVTTHSSHIAYEDFRFIRYFRRMEERLHQSEVCDLSVFYNRSESATRDFLMQYLKLTHCDLFFADAAILVEGNVERILVPLIVSRDCPQLNSQHLTLLEVGGAFAHKFQQLINFLKLPCLIVTDIDSVAKQEGSAKKTACPTGTDGATTSNPILKDWIPKLSDIKELLSLDDEKKHNAQLPPIRVAYQTKVQATWGEQQQEVAGRTLEEAFAYQNLSWTQDPLNRSAGLAIHKNDSDCSISYIVSEIYNRVHDHFDKTKFALAVVNSTADTWVSPSYIVEGLHWLSKKLFLHDAERLASRSAEATSE